MRARGVLRVHQVFIGGFSLMYGLTALLTVLGGIGRRRPARRPGGRAVDRHQLGGVGRDLDSGGAVANRAWVAVFALYADVAVFAVIAWCQDAFTAMPGLALLATNGIYIVIGHGPRALLAHLVFTVLVFGWFYVLAIAQGETSAAVVTVRLLVLLPTVVGVPVIVHSYLLTLRMGAVDALIDPLTRLLNRRGLDVDGEELVLAGEGHVSVLAVDIDKFKNHQRQSRSRRR